jgi:hypothetical protein
VGEGVLTFVCPKCKPIKAFLESIGLTPEQALAFTLLGWGLIYLSRN